MEITKYIILKGRLGNYGRFPLESSDGKIHSGDTDLTLGRAFDSHPTQRNQNKTEIMGEMVDSLNTSL